jgi:hypothetical protein
LGNYKPHIIKHIAEELDCGYDVYFNVNTEECLSIPSSSNAFFDDTIADAFQTDLEKVNNQRTDFIKFEVLNSFESFKIMEGFVAQLPHQDLKVTLENALSNRKPFRHFKNLVETSYLRQDWFDFKQKELEKIVATTLKIR